jgi:hypothetical protein
MFIKSLHHHFDFNIYSIFLFRVKENILHANFHYIDLVVLYEHHFVNERYCMQIIFFLYKVILKCR